MPYFLRKNKDEYKKSDGGIRTIILQTKNDHVDIDELHAHHHPNVRCSTQRTQSNRIADQLYEN